MICKDRLSISTSWFFLSILIIFSSDNFPGSFVNDHDIDICIICGIRYMVLVVYDYEVIVYASLG